MNQRVAVRTLDRLPANAGDINLARSLALIAFCLVSALGANRWFIPADGGSLHIFPALAVLAGLAIGASGYLVLLAGILSLLVTTGLSGIPGFVWLQCAAAGMVMALAFRFEHTLATALGTVSLWPLAIVAPELLSLSQATWLSLSLISASMVWLALPSTWRDYLHYKRAISQGILAHVVSATLASAVWISAMLLFVMDQLAAESFSREQQTRLQQSAVLAEVAIEEFIALHGRALFLAKELSFYDLRHTWDHLNAIRASFPGFISLLQADADGNVVIVAFSGNEDQDSRLASSLSIADREYFRSAKPGSLFVSDAFEGRGLGNDRLIALATKTEDGDVLQGSITVGRLADALAAATEDFDSLLLLDRAGNIILGEVRPNQRARVLSRTLQNGWQIHAMLNEQDTRSIDYRVLLAMALIGLLVLGGARYSGRLSALVSDLTHKASERSQVVPNTPLRPGPGAPAELHTIAREINDSSEVANASVATRQNAQLGLAHYTTTTGDATLTWLLDQTLQANGLTPSHGETPVDVCFSAVQPAALDTTIWIPFALGPDACNHGLQLPAGRRDLHNAVFRAVSDEHAPPVLEETIIAGVATLHTSGRLDLVKMVRNALQEITTGLATGPLTAKDCHRLRGKFASFGAAHLAATLAQLETNPDASDHLVPRVRLAAWLFVLELADRLGEPLSDFLSTAES